MSNNSLFKKAAVSIKNGTFLERVKAYFNYGDTLIRMQIKLEELPPLYDITPFYIKEMNISNSQEIEKWINIINDGYDDANYDMKAAKNHFNNHIFLNISNTYFIMDENNPIGAISIGKYRGQKIFGGDARIAVKQGFQGKGLGKYIVLYGFHKLREQGVEMGETMISLKRKASIYSHLHLGFVPQPDLKKCHFKDHSFFVNRIIANYRVKKIYSEYIDRDVKY